MSKVVAVSMAVVLLVGSSAFGDVPAALSQIQNTNIGLTNVIDLLNGDQAASALQNLAVQNDQFTEQPPWHLRQPEPCSESSRRSDMPRATARSWACCRTWATIGMQAQMLDDGMGRRRKDRAWTFWPPRAC